jgi:2,4-didehydro-3-deoxy-L-rhamnonate hydrolase
VKLVTYVGLDGAPRPGALRDDEVIDLSPAAASILELIRGGESALERARERVWRAEASGLIEQVRLLAPIPRPANHLYCVGWNYPKHHDEGVGKRAGQETDELNHPTFFSKPPGTVIGPYDPIAWDPSVTERLDYEGELALVLGHGGRSIRKHEALAYVFGYMLANDISARDIQRRHGGQWLKGKGMDTYCPLGPVLVTADELDPTSLVLCCSVNGELRQEASIATMIFPIETLIAELSFGMTLYPGDIILTGTPDGVGFAREPAVFLEPGDIIEVETAEIGRLRNQVRESSLSTPGASSSRSVVLPP